MPEEGGDRPGALAAEANPLKRPSPVFTPLPRERKCFQGTTVTSRAVCFAESACVKPVDFNKRGVLAGRSKSCQRGNHHPLLGSTSSFKRPPGNWFTQGQWCMGPALCLCVCVPACACPPLCMCIHTLTRRPRGRVAVVSFFDHLSE